jgi:hypothetical protein
MHFRRAAALLPFVILLPAGAVAQQPDSTHAQVAVGWSLQLRSVQLEGVTFLYTFGWGISADVDVYRIASSEYESFGVRLGREQFRSGDPGGGGEGPFNDYNLLLRFSTGPESMRFDICAGYSYRQDTHANSYAPIAASGVKFEFNVRVNFVSFLYFGAIVKAGLCGFFTDAAHNSGALNSGIGLYAGWDNR